MTNNEIKLCPYLEAIEIYQYINQFNLDQFMFDEVLYILKHLVRSKETGTANIFRR